MPPARYTKIKSQYRKKGKSLAEAKRIAAMTENALRKEEGKPAATFHKKKAKKR
jgi:hypothetical protein